MTVIMFLLGVVGGALLNSLADSLPPDDRGGRRPGLWPHCRACGRFWSRGDILAVLAWFRQREQCPQCGTRRPPRSAWAEVGLGLAWAAAWTWAGGSLARFWPAAVWLAVFELVVIIDLEHRLILWAVIIPASVLALAVGILDPARGPFKTVVGGVAGYAVMWLVFMLSQGYMWWMARVRGEPLTEVAFGGGDVNLSGLIGLVVGWTGILVALVIAIMSGGLFSLGYLLVQSWRGRYNPHTPIPYGPFLILGAVVVYFLGAQIRTWGAVP